MKNNWIRWTKWEYWPWWIANIPVYLMYAWFALRSGKIFFFSNVNPAIPLGGAMGESKYDILKLLPLEIQPRMILARVGTAIEQIRQQMSEAGIFFPIIVKPDVGERGFLVEKIIDENMLVRHLQEFPVDFLIQEFIALPLEFSVLFHRFPDGRFAITSVCAKEFLQVRGDGHSTVEDLMALQTRAALQLKRISRQQPDLMGYRPGLNQTVLIEPIGNHARGTKFMNANSMIDEELQRVFEPVGRGLDGIYYGRFDLKCASVEALRRGEFVVMELNGVLGEPAHVYDPGYGMWRAYRDLYRHWKIIYQLHRVQSQRGVGVTPAGAGFRQIRDYFKYKKQHSNPRSVI